jgi:hypothetical protein
MVCALHAKSRFLVEKSSGVDAIAKSAVERALRADQRCFAPAHARSPKIMSTKIDARGDLSTKKMAHELAARFP